MFSRTPTENGSRSSHAICFLVRSFSPLSASSPRGICCSFSHALRHLRRDLRNRISLQRKCVFAENTIDTLCHASVFFYRLPVRSLHDDVFFRKVSMFTVVDSCSSMFDLVAARQRSKQHVPSSAAVYELDSWCFPPWREKRLLIFQL